MKQSLLLSVVALALVTSSSEAADWMRFRGPQCSGVSTDTGLPTTWNATENVIWKTPMPGFGASSPITVGDRVFLTAYSGYGLSEDEPGEMENLTHHFLCVDRNSGKILWDKRSRALQPEEPYRSFIALHGYASNTPVSDGENVYVFLGKSGVWAYTLDGKNLWKISVGQKTHGWGSGTSLLLAGNALIVNASVESQSVWAIDKRNGEGLWRVEGINDSWATPVLLNLPDGKQELVVSLREKILGLDPATGEQLWYCDGVKDYVCPSVIAHDDVAYVTGGRGAALLTAIRGGGRGDVTETHRLWELRKTSKVSTPVYHDGLIYWVNHQGVACCVDATNGELVYQERMKIEGRRDLVYASPVLADGKLYVVSRQGGAIVLATGREFKELARNDLGDDSVFNGTPVIDNSRLLLRSDRFLYCLGKK